jgi:HK97 family phage major capsid protein
MSNEITKVISETSPMRQICKVQQISGDALEIIEDTEEAFAGWTLETELRSETNTPHIGKRVIPVHELYAQPKATQKLIDDSSVDIENLAIGKVGRRILKKRKCSFHQW